MATEKRDRQAIADRLEALKGSKSDYTDEQKLQAFDLFMGGDNYGAVAKKVKCHRATAQAWCETFIRVILGDKEAANYIDIKA